MLENRVFQKRFSLVFTGNVLNWKLEQRSNFLCKPNEHEILVLKPQAKMRLTNQIAIFFEGTNHLFHELIKFDSHNRIVFIKVASTSQNFPIAGGVVNFTAVN